MKPALLILCLGFLPLAAAAEATYSIKALTPETALKAAQAALKKCRDGGFQVTVAVVDRMGVAQVLLRDRYAGPHTLDMARAKAYTAVSFRTNTTELAEAKRIYVERLKAGKIEKPTAVDEVHRRVMKITGRDPLPYGIAPNRKTLEEVIQSALEQGIITRPVAVEELFARNTHGLVA